MTIMVIIMACSRCEERRRALVAGASSLAQGDVRSTASAVAFVAKTSAEDLRSIARRSAQKMARLNLSRR